MSYEPLIPPSRGVVPSFHEEAYENPNENPFLYKKPKKGHFGISGPVAPLSSMVHSSHLAAQASEAIVDEFDSLVNTVEDIGSDIADEAGSIIEEAGHLIEQGITGTAHLLSVGIWDFIKGLGPWVTIGGIILGIVILTIVIKVVL